VTSIAERQTTGAQNEVNISEWKSLRTSLDRRRGRLDVLCASTVSIAQPTEAKKTPAATAATAAARRFNTPQQAADALIDAAEKFDVAELAYIFGPDGEDVVFSGEFAQDRQHAANFVAEAHEKKSVSVDPRTGTEHSCS